MRLSNIALAITAAYGKLFSPSSLFAASEQGVWYEPSLTNGTCFQDSSGTTPVTAVEQPVGLMLDKSKGLVLGSELVTNGGFSGGTTGWIAFGSVAPTLTTISGELQVLTNEAAPGGAYQAITTVVGKWYTVAAKIRRGDGVDVRMRAVTSTPAGTLLAESATVTSASATSVTLTFVATSTSTAIYARVNANGIGQTGFFDNISVRELPGNHATQTTSTSRPVLSARVNLLTKTEQFDDAVWVKSNATVTTNSAIAPDGTLTADKVVDSTTDSSHLVYQTQTTPSGVSLVASVYLKAGELGYAGIQMFSGARPTVLVNLSTGALSVFGTSPAAFSSTNAGNGWWRVSITATTGATSSTVIVFPSNSATPANQNNQARYIGNGTDGIYICGADLRVANTGVDLPAYQRVNTSTDYDTTGFPMYLRFDGVDDGMVTNSINFTSTDKMTVWAGVRKLSDAATGVLVESSATVAANAGSFVIAAPNNTGASGNYSIYSRGNIAPSTPANSAITLAPVTSVVSGFYDISGDTMRIRVNGGGEVTNTADQGTGNFGNYPLYIGRRGGTTLPANLNLYSLIVRGAQSNTGQIASTESWINEKAKAY